MTRVGLRFGFEQLDPDVRDALTDWLADCDLDWQPGQMPTQLKTLPKELQPVRELALIELLKIDLERHRQCRAGVTVESYLAQFPELAASEVVIPELLVVEWECRQQAGEAPRFGEFARRFPQYAGVLRMLLQGRGDTNSGAKAETETAPREHDTAEVLGGLVDSALQPTGTLASTVAMATATPLDIPTQLGRYHIIRKLGEGAMGAVYLAHDPQLRRDVALKIPSFDRVTRAEVLKRFDREAKAAASLDHPHICHVYDTGEAAGYHFLVMEFIDGQPLSEVIATDRSVSKRDIAEPPRLTDEVALRLVQQVALAFEVAHEREIIHRDLKPSNIMLTQDGQPKVTDFGLARMRGLDDQRLTQSGMMLGTPAYMPPEQLKGELAQIGPQSDVYSLGVILFELLTGRLPHEIDRNTPFAVMCSRLLTDEPSSLSTHRPDLDPRLEEIFQRATAKQLADRFVSMAEFATALQAVLEEPQRDLGERTPITGGLTPLNSNRPHRSPRTRHLLVLAFVAAILLGATLWFVNGDAVVKVEILADDVEVTFIHEAIKVVDGKKEYRVKPGPQRLHVKSGDIEFDSDSFILKRGSNPVVTIERKDKRLLARWGAEAIGHRDQTVAPPTDPPKKPPETKTAQAVANQPAAENSKPDVIQIVKLSRSPIWIEGGWTIENDELVTEQVGIHSHVITFGDAQWRDYDLRYECRCDTLGVSYNTVFRSADKHRFWLLQFGNYGAKNLDLVSFHPGEYGWKHPSRRYLPNSRHGLAEVWQKVEIKARGARIEVTVDGKLQCESSHPHLVSGYVGFHTFGKGRARWRNIEVRSPDGELLWQGLPAVPPKTAANVRDAPQFVLGMGQGKWRIDNGKLSCAEPSSDSEDWLFVGHPEWTDYDFVVAAGADQPLQGHGPGVLFRSRSKDHAYQLATNVFGSTRDYIDEYDGPEHRKSSWNDASIPRFIGPSVRNWSGGGHVIRLSLRGTQLRVFIDDQETMSYDKVRHSKGYVGLRSHKDWPSRFWNPRVIAPDGEYLLHAWPELPEEIKAP